MSEALILLRNTRLLLPQRFFSPKAYPIPRGAFVWIATPIPPLNLANYCMESNFSGKNQSEGESRWILYSASWRQATR